MLIALILQQKKLIHLSLQKELKKLEILDLFNCEVTEQPEYRKKVFDMLPELKFLDGYDRNDQEIEDDEEEDGGGKDF